ncbi:phosphodiester glycosidase family protein [Vannielia sp.]|uniref:phosphodiester glycosidase family protein n=1 Tax=Vannielia sp. TaxID=2813045 RepID=UPI00262F2D58|nr:phosphodiester glycosidase family protein [Vannielia sp.]MDF1871011.1 phosphodiester glycosidase family protein [Vannielia sp.]
MAVAAPECRDTAHAGRAFTICTLNAAQDDIRLFHKSDGQVLGSFNRLDTALADQGLALTFAMNAGMYHDDRRPVGLYVEEGEETARLIPNPGPGNFGLLPNGVFCLTEGRAAVIETLAFRDNPPACRFASQSGPMLVIDGALHPKFLPDSTSRHFRNGVGVEADGQTVHFAISDERVTFWEFATLFRDVLNTPNALYFDGNVSRLFAPAIGRNDTGFAMGPMVGAVAPRQ